MVKVKATVDTIKEPPENGWGLGVFRVEVWGEAPHDFVRVYTIRAKSDNVAAREGLERFVAEFEQAGTA